MTKAVQTFDRATMVVVCVCWGVAVLMMAFAMYAVILSASTRRASETAAAAEPILPKIVRKPIETVIPARSSSGCSIDIPKSTSPEQ